MIQSINSSQGIANIIKIQEDSFIRLARKRKKYRNTIYLVAYFYFYSGRYFTQFDHSIGSIYYINTVFWTTTVIR